VKNMSDVVLRKVNGHLAKSRRIMSRRIFHLNDQGEATPMKERDCDAERSYCVDGQAVAKTVTAGGK
jgi:hypothetical protein